jgi:hypothetical protein
MFLARGHVDDLEVLVHDQVIVADDREGGLVGVV